MYFYLVLGATPDKTANRRPSPTNWCARLGGILASLGVVSRLFTASPFSGKLGTLFDGRSGWKWLRDALNFRRAILSGKVRFSNKSRTPGVSRAQ